mmetsp:Transcript_27870/g.81925  ORF Transcript_27870/g.81925 Transcript_27870/m.81925 type:complete len:281 (+) Transcript_27870:108-950(+)
MVSNLSESDLYSWLRSLDTESRARLLRSLSTLEQQQPSEQQPSSSSEPQFAAQPACSQDLQLGAEPPPEAGRPAGPLQPPPPPPLPLRVVPQAQAPSDGEEPGEPSDGLLPRRVRFGDRILEGAAAAAAAAAGRRTCLGPLCYQHRRLLPRRLRRLRRPAHRRAAAAAGGRRGGSCGCCKRVFARVAVRAALRRRCGQQPVLPAPRRRLFLGARAGVLCRWQEGALGARRVGAAGCGALPREIARRGGRLAAVSAVPHAAATDRLPARLCLCRLAGHPRR